MTTSFSSVSLFSRFCGLRPLRRTLGLWIAVATLTTGWVASSEAADSSVDASPIVQSAEDLAARTSLDATDYRHGKWDVEWENPAHCYTDCSGFLDAVLLHSYRWSRDDLRHWLQSGRPNAAVYYHAIEGGNGFTSIPRIQDIIPGDVLAVLYLKRTDNSGHIMIADGAAVQRPGSAPLVAQTVQWEIPIIDCSESGHGPQDTRHKMGADGKDHPGLGKGSLRLYAKPTGEIVGFSWSVLKASSFKSAETEPLLVGRLRNDFRP
jgi:hypothetical protein